jgi:asparagine synthetase B (glutamine-hydrolysing)
VSAARTAPAPLSPLEVAAGVVVGSEPAVPLPDTPASPLSALEEAVLPAVARPPCLVSFSGGRDSSAVLAVAAKVARREGLPLPVAATMRFPGTAEADERAWQERVIAHLGLEDWHRVDAGQELDCVGPVATRVLSRHGLLWPPNAHFHVPLLEAASGGSLLTGVGGDEVFGGNRWGRALAVLTGRALPTPRDTLRVALALAPPALRRAVLRRRPLPPFPWLRPAAARAVEEAFVRDTAGEPLRPRRRLAWLLSLRYLRVSRASLELLARDAGATIAHPLTDPGFCAALAPLLRRRAGEGRTKLLAAVAGDVLPEDVVARRGKARFGHVAWGEHSRAFVAAWDGRGFDPELVDVDVLRDCWPQAEEDGRLLTLLQVAWLAGRQLAGDEVEQAVERVGK